MYTNYWPTITISLVVFIHSLKVITNFCKIRKHQDKSQSSYIYDTKYDLKFYIIWIFSLQPKFMILLMSSSISFEITNMRK